VETVRFYDPITKSVIDIPDTELAPGVIQIVCEGQPVWVLPADLATSFQQTTIKRPPFPQHVKYVLSALQATFKEHLPHSIEEWEDGFRREQNPDRQIWDWMHAATTYQRFTRNELLPHRRKDIFRVILSCINAPPADVWRVLDIGSLRLCEAENIVNFYYAGPSEPDAEDSG
jgi:hypothetical protein